LARNVPHVLKTLGAQRCKSAALKSEAVGLGAAVSDVRTSVMKAAQLFALRRAMLALRLTEKTSCGVARMLACALRLATRRRASLGVRHANGGAMDALRPRRTQ